MLQQWSLNSNRGHFLHYINKVRINIAYSDIKSVKFEFRVFEPRPVGRIPSVVTTDQGVTVNIAYLLEQRWHRTTTVFMMLSSKSLGKKEQQ